jgi:hypothetical protein
MSTAVGLIALVGGLVVVWAAANPLSSTRVACNAPQIAGCDA